MELRQLIDVAAGRRPADLILRNGKVVNVLSDEIYEADIAITAGRIAGIGRYDAPQVVDLKGRYVCPGFIDAHVHIESSMLSVPEFAGVVAAHGTTAVVTDPHEVANVMGTEGIRFMLAASKYCPVRVYVMLSSCIPASALESAGAELTAVDLLPLFTDEWVLGLAEVMNYRGVVDLEDEVLDKLKVARGRIIDGHAPGLSGRELQAYVAAGIGSDHECTTAEEAREKLRLGLFVMIREGTQARNLDALLPLVTPATVDRFMFVTDDKDVEDLLDEGHIDHMVCRAIAAGLKPTLAIRLASFNAARYFGLEGFGAIAPGYHAALTVLEDLNRCRVTQVYQDGSLVAENGQSVYEPPPHRRSPILRSAINVQWLEVEQFAVPARSAGSQRVHVIEMTEDQLQTKGSVEALPVVDGKVMPDPARDVAKIMVIERHQASGRVGLGFVRGFGLRSGAIASSVAHDAHNLIVAGTNDRDMYHAAVHVVKMRGGLCAAKDGRVLADVPLPIAGLMSDAPALELRGQVQALNAATRELGCSLRRPFMALSFMSLSVIGSLRITDQGLINVDKFARIDLFVP